MPKTLQVGEEIHVPDHLTNETLRVRRVSLEDLTPAPYNPRVIAEGALKNLASLMSRFGIADLMVWNEKTGHVIGGHQRLKVLKEKGITDTLVIVRNDEETEEKALNLSLNNERAQGDWDFEPLAQIIEELKADDSFDLEDIGWPEEIVDPLLNTEWTSDSGDDIPELERHFSVRFTETQWNKIVDLVRATRDSNKLKSDGEAIVELVLG